MATTSIYDAYVASVKERVDITPATAEQYIYLARRLERITEDISDTEAVLGYLKEKELGLSSQASFLNVAKDITRPLKESPMVAAHNTYTAAHDAVMKAIIDRPRVVSSSMAAETLMADVDDYIESALTSNDSKTIKAALVLSLWRDTRGRPQEFSGTIIYRSLPEDGLEPNYIVMGEEPYISISEYKTVSTYGPKKVVLSMPSVVLLTKFGGSRTPAYNAALGLIKHALGKDATFNKLRSASVRDSMDDEMVSAFRALEALANSRGHSLKTAIDWYVHRTE